MFSKPFCFRTYANNAANSWGQLPALAPRATILRGKWRRASDYYFANHGIWTNVYRGVRHLDFSVQAARVSRSRLAEAKLEVKRRRASVKQF
jgi:hypothetical protein